LYRDDLVQLKENPWESPGIVIRGAYGSILPVKMRWTGKVLASTETLVVDVVVGTKVYCKIPVENLKKIG
jgi:hypothetical protein